MDQNPETTANWFLKATGGGGGDASIYQRRVCITGAGGYIASWLVKLLLSRDYTVIGTVRNPDDEKYVELKKLDQDNKLKLVKADLLDYPSLSAAINGCHGVFHLACPVSAEVEVTEPIVKGSQNVLKACYEAGVKRVVMVSSVAALVGNPSWPQGLAFDETCWSDLDFCKSTIKNWYVYSKTLAEIEAFEYARRTGLSLVSLLPSLVWGPILLHQAPNTSIMALLNLIKEGYDKRFETSSPMVDVRDVAEALLMVYEIPDAEGRYICSSHPTSATHKILKKHFPDSSFSKRNIEDIKERRVITLTSEKLQRLGWRFRSLENTVIDSVVSFKQLGLLSD